MTVFTIDPENNITAFADEQPEMAAGAGGQTFASHKELATLAADWPVTRLVETWNRFASVVPLDHLKPLKRFTDRNTAVSRVWRAIQKLAPATEANTVAQQGADCVPTGSASTKATTSQPKRPKAPKLAQGGKSGPHKVRPTQGRDGSKKAEVLAMIERPKGATLAEIQKATGWQAHSVRGFISGTVGRNMGLAVESTRREDGERVYRLAGLRGEA